MLSSVRVFLCVCVSNLSKIENVLFIFECHPLLSSYGIYICMSNGCMYVYILYMYGIYLYTYIHLYITRAPAQGIATLANESNVVMGSGWRRPTVYRGGRWRCVCVCVCVCVAPAPISDAAEGHRPLCRYTHMCIVYITAYMYVYVYMCMFSAVNLHRQCLLCAYFSPV